MTNLDQEFEHLEEGKVYAPPAGQKLALRERAARLVPKPILTLETVAPERPTIQIDGIAYRLAFTQDFTLRQNLRMARLGERANEIDALALADDAEAVSVEQWAAFDDLQRELYGEMVAIVLPDLPEPTRLALTLAHAKAIVDAFFTHNQSSTTAAGGAESAPTPATGETSSAPSAPASAAPGRTGSRKRRSATSSPPTGA
jgi:hypothetical protein